MFNANGGVWIIPGSHKWGLMPHRMTSTHWVWTGSSSEGVEIKADAGDVLIFSSYSMHRTGPNLTDGNRIAYLVEFMDRKYFDVMASLRNSQSATCLCCPYHWDCLFNSNR